MRLPFKRTALAASAGLLVTLSGCATKSELMPEPELPEPVRAMDVGVNYIEPTSDIVIMDPSYQHVVLPNGSQVAYRPGWEEEAMAAAAGKLDSSTDDGLLIARDKIGKNSGDVKPDEIRALSLSDLPLADESDDPVYRAWHKLCSMNFKDMTKEEYQIITQKDSMPSVFEGVCNEGLAWLAEMK